MLAKMFIGFVALQHIAFLILESFLWTHPIGLKIFSQSLEAAKHSKNLAANQGLYNGFLAAGLIWSLISTQQIIQTQGAIFFLSCVIIAGVIGGLTVSYRITLIQSLPALLALALVLFKNSK